MITFLLSGIWHGANWTFGCWGGIHGIQLCTEKNLDIDRNKYAGFNWFIHWSTTFAIVCLAWILFRANTLPEAMLIISGLIIKMDVPDITFAMFTEITLALMALAILFCKELSEELEWKPIQHWNSAVVSHLYMVSLIVFILLFGVLDGDQFIYFQF